MEVKLIEVTIRDLQEGYQDHDEEGVVGYGGRLDIRPPYQREFVYKDKQRDAVIETVKKGFPLNTMYWAVRKDGNYEIIDGQQRTISICRYVHGDFSYKGLYFQNLQDDQQDQILNYPLTIYECSGTDGEKLDWFRTVNIAGEELTEQELRNATFHGPWLYDAKRYFSRTGCPAFQIGNRYLTGTPIRQDYLETAIKWISNNNIEDYMGRNQDKPSANELWLYFQSVISWVDVTFPQYRREMKGIQWAELYNAHKNDTLDPHLLEEEIEMLFIDPDVTNNKGIYTYVLNGEERYLNIRKFDEIIRREVYELQKGICVICKEHFDIDEMEADHITPWSQGGKTEIGNCQMLCSSCNRRKSDS